MLRIQIAGLLYRVILNYIAFVCILLLDESDTLVHQCDGTFVFLFSVCLKCGLSCM